jgi:hypothetical protein
VIIRADGALAEVFKGWFYKKVLDIIYDKVVMKLWSAVSSRINGTFKRQNRLSTSKKGANIIKVNASIFDPFNYDNWVGDGYPNKSQRVRDLQIALSQAYYSPGSIDGIWGPNTKAALIHMQEDRGLVAQGVCSTATWKVLSTN